ncbi:MAG: SpoVR family protein, partial [Thermodesulfobacteriota bacterium]
GRYSFDFLFLKDEVARKKYTQNKNHGDEFILDVRENFIDFTFINTFIDQDFIAKHKLFVTGKYLDQSSMKWKYYIKSKKAQDYKEMIIDTLYHPPKIFVDEAATKEGILYLNHKFEDKPLKIDYIENTMIGIEYLWGGPVHLETSEPVVSKKTATSYASFWDPGAGGTRSAEQSPEDIKWKRVRYVIENRKLYKKEL